VQPWVGKLFDLTTLEDKVKKIDLFLRNARDHRNPNDLVLNHISGTGGLDIFLTPLIVSRTTNQYLLDFHTSKLSMGVIIMDFPGQAHIDKVIYSNHEGEVEPVD